MVILIKKIDGTTQPYDGKRVLNSLQHAGADIKTAQDIEAKIQSKLYNGMDTRTLFSYAFRELKKYHPVTAARYDLKNSLLRLGASGYPFEQYIATIMEAQGYKTQTNVIVQGTIIPHEIDVIAEKGTEKIMVECKHHRREFIVAHIQTALYVYARFLDVKKNFTTPMLATNTKFTPQVLTYARGVGLRLLGWSYPKGNGLEDLLAQYKLYPITMHHMLDQRIIDKCLENNIVLLTDIERFTPKKLSTMLEISETKAKQIIDSVDGYWNPTTKREVGRKK